MTVKRMDNVLIVVDDLEAAKEFFIELGLRLEGETTVEGPLVERLIGSAPSYGATYHEAVVTRYRPGRLSLLKSLSVIRQQS